MNGFQKKIVARAIAISNAAIETRPRQFTAGDREFLADLNRRPDDYILSVKQNSWLNDISQKIGQMSCALTGGMQRLKRIICPTGGEP